MMLDITFRAATRRDLPSLNHLMFDLHHEHHLSCPEFFKEATEIEQEKNIADYLNNPDCLVFVAVIEHSIVGFISGHFCELISSVSKSLTMGSVDELYVIPHYRKQKIAHTLFEHIECTFKEYGVEQIFVEVWNFNQLACEFYHKQGFQHHIHYLRKSIKKENNINLG